MAWQGRRVTAVALAGLAAAACEDGAAAVDRLGDAGPPGELETVAVFREGPIGGLAADSTGRLYARTARTLWTHAPGGAGWVPVETRGASPLALQRTNLGAVLIELGAGSSTERWAVARGEAIEALIGRAELESERAYLAGLDQDAGGGFVAVVGRLGDGAAPEVRVRRRGPGAAGPFADVGRAAAPLVATRAWITAAGRVALCGRPPSATLAGGDFGELRTQTGEHLVLARGAPWCDFRSAGALLVRGPGIDFCGIGDHGWVDCWRDGAARSVRVSAGRDGALSIGSHAVDGAGVLWALERTDGTARLLALDLRAGGSWKVVREGLGWQAIGAGTPGELVVLDAWQEGEREQRVLRWRIPAGR